jgi:hypothetical protein
MNRRGALAGASVSSNWRVRLPPGPAIAPTVYLPARRARHTNLDDDELLNERLAKGQGPNPTRGSNSFADIPRIRLTVRAAQSAAPGQRPARLAHSTLMRSAQAISVARRFHVSHERPSVCQRDPLVAKILQQCPAARIDCRLTSLARCLPLAAAARRPRMVSHCTHETAVRHCHWRTALRPCDGQNKQDPLPHGQVSPCRSFRPIVSLALAQHC